ncbi:MAG: nucleoside deaminase [Zavarzinella sp.]
MTFDLVSAMQELFTQPDHPIHRYGMSMALEAARTAYDRDEVPVGAAIISGEQGLIATAYNQREELQDPTAHAEMIALTQASAALHSWRLENCILYVTLEPCPMCAGAIVQARIPFVVYGTTDSKAGACHTLYQITNDERLNHRCTVLGGVMAEESKFLLSSFFQAKRRMGKK